MIVAVLLGAAWCWWLAPVPAQPAHLEAKGVVSAPPAPEKARASATIMPMTDAGDTLQATPEPPVDWKQRLRESDDYWAFAESAQEAGHRGDAAAQYYLSVALDVCSIDYSMYFLDHRDDDTEHHMTVEEARVHALSAYAHPRFATDEELSLLQRRCKRLNEPRQPPFGYADEWVKEAADAGYPLAQASAAIGEAIHFSDASREKARKLALVSLRTKDPAVFLLISDLSKVLVQDNEAEGRLRRLAWKRAACSRSPDCEALAESASVSCKTDPACQPYETPLDILKREAGNDFNEVEQRAKELDEKIDSGALKESDI